MTAEELRELIDTMLVDIEFQYLGVWGAICPFHRDEISVSYGDDERTFHSIDDAMNEPFITGRPLREICGEFSELSY